MKCHSEQVFGGLGRPSDPKLQTTETAPFIRSIIS